MKAKFFSIILIFFFSIIFLIFYKGLQNSNIYVPEKIIKKTPTFRAEVFLTNEKVNSNDLLSGDFFYLINIWSSWCVPCKDEHLFLMKLKEQKNLRIIGLNYKDKKQNAQNFLKELDNPYSIILNDTKGTLAIEWGAYGVPESFLVYDKKIIKKIIGPIDRKSLITIMELIK
tara:strand:+ start:2570 stop:3085 length:516 start_codon:yes stop_codon:yes gene_type:complete